jgi:hypothetical protein
MLGNPELRPESGLIMYYLQSGWFEEGPQRGSATQGKGLKALQTPCCRWLRRKKSSLPCRLSRDQRDPGMCLGALGRMQAVVH